MANVDQRNCPGLSFAKQHACGFANGQLECWGDNLVGQMGGTTGGARQSPQTPGLGGGFVDVALGAQHGCGLKETGEISCWGLDRFIIGDAYRPVFHADPKTLTDVGSGVAIAAGRTNTCAVLSKTGN